MAQIQNGVLQYGVGQREELVDSARAEKEDVMCIILTTQWP